MGGHFVWVNNILAVIMGYSNLLLEDEALKDEAKEQLREIYTAGERAANLTRQLLTFSRKKEMEVNPLILAILARTSDCSATTLPTFPPSRPTRG